MEAAYYTRYGTLDAQVLQLHCILSANQYQSWFIPTGQNKIDWEPSGWNYMMNLYQDWQLRDVTPSRPICNNLELFVKALLRRELVLPTQMLLKHLNKTQLEHLLRQYVSHREDSVLPVTHFGDETRIRSSILSMNQSLWIGAGYLPRFYDSNQDE